MKTVSSWSVHHRLRRPLAAVNRGGNVDESAGLDIEHQVVRTIESRSR